MTTTEQQPARRPSSRPTPSTIRRPRTTAFSPWPTLILVIGAIYCLVPVLWVIIASTKSQGELFSTFTFAPGTALWENLTNLFAYNGGVYLSWAGNSLLYAGVGSVLATLISTLAGYAIAKYEFRGRNLIFFAILGGVLLPGMVLAIPQYMIMTQVGMVGSYWSVLLPGLISPFGIYLARVYAGASVPTETIEAARIDGAGEYRIFGLIVLPMMLPGMVTIFMLQFVGSWNNFLLPYIMLSDESKFPITLGLYSVLSKGSGEPALYGVAIIGAAVSVIPLIALLLGLQRFWKLDLISGGLKG